ncbi:lipoprotein [Streptomyces fumigatiscleroticus]|nr:lipoprotein [Streptomyces fumigatiscleroticus]
MLFRPASRTFLLPASLTALAVLGLGACDSGREAKPAADGPSVIVPGRPGEANRTLSAEDASGQRADDDSPNSADVGYARMMIQHHSQALEMTALALEHAGSARVKRLAERIAAAQGPEIATMRAWLKAHGEQETGGGHDHAAMPGMATEAQLEELRAADGKAFDRLFLTLMITHHEGAVTMATDVKAQGNNVQIEEMADDTVAQQTSEITRMRDLM